MYNREKIANNDFDYARCKISVVIPMYNAEDYIRECILSVHNQVMDSALYEIIVVDNCSTDNSVCIIESLNIPNLLIVEQEEKGVSKARNKGVSVANGKYILFLDADDTISNNTLSETVIFFDDNYEEIDLLSYGLKYLHSDGNTSKHYRSKYLNKTGIYSIDERRYINLTTMNIVVKNGINIFDENISFHEDELYIAEIVLNKRRYGYVDEATYYYRRHENSVTSVRNNPYYIFEQSIALYERLAEKYKSQDSTDLYIQELILNDLSWKIPMDILLPHHYSANNYVVAKERVIALIQCIDDSTILNHPNMDIYHKFYLINVKGKKLQVVIGNPGVGLVCSNLFYYYRKNIEFVLTRFDMGKKSVLVEGYFKSPIFQFLETVPTFYMIKNDERTEFDSKISSWSYYKSKVKTNIFYSISERIEFEDNLRFRFVVSINGVDISTNLYYMPSVAFSSKYRRYNIAFDNYKIEIKKNVFIGNYITENEREELVRRETNKFWKSNKRIWLLRTILWHRWKKRSRIWLYYDCHGVKRDNGYYQFIHDIKKDDGITRYYVINDDIEGYKDLFSIKEFGYVIRFGSIKHKYLYVLAEMIITAYIELDNYMPFTWDTFAKISDFAKHEVVYLQHGILHAHLPWKYSCDRQETFRQVISTYFEETNLKENYGFEDKNLIKTGMPRYDYVDSEARPKKKILFAPSWRKYLIKNVGGGKWEKLGNAFVESKLYLEWMKFLTSKRLKEVLDAYGYSLEFKLHPIFECYREEFNVFSDHINVVCDKVQESDYSVIITDFSSYYFDFIYLKRAVIYFIPDYDEFKAGLNDYRELDLPFESGYGDCCFNSDEVINSLEVILKNNGNPNKEYEEKMRDSFFYYDNKQCDRIYDELMK